MRLTIISVAISLVLSTLSILVVEGVASIASWKHADTSLVYGIYARFLAPSNPAGQDQPGFPAARRDQIEALIPDMLAAGVAMGNVPRKFPYQELINNRVAINAAGAKGCRAQKPSTDKVTTYIRSGDYDRFDPPSLFYDNGANLGPNLRRFIDTYGVHSAHFSSNSFGERTTVPAVISQKKVLLAGDSVAAGAMLGDEQTLASQLQRANTDLQFINLGVVGATAEETICRLGMAAERYKGEIHGFIYVYCENDFNPSLPYGRPEEVIEWLKKYRQENGIGSVTIVLAPYIYNIVPSMTRFAGSRGAEHGFFGKEASRLKAEAELAGFNFISIADVARNEARRQGTDFAALSMFVDPVHLSDYGTSLLVKALPDLN